MGEGRRVREERTLDQRLGQASCCSEYSERDLQRSQQRFKKTVLLWSHRGELQFHSLRPALMANQESHGFILSSWERNGCGWEAEIMLIKHTKEMSFNAQVAEGWEPSSGSGSIINLLCYSQQPLSPGVRSYRKCCSTGMTGLLMGYHLYNLV